MKHNDALSSLQQKLLLAIADRYQQGPIEKGWGVRYRVKAGLKRTQQAAYARALKRLERRGLVERKNVVSGPAPNEFFRKHRTTHVVLLPAGFALVERLTQASFPCVNRVERTTALGA